jgi:hypothetical protein
MHSLDVAWLTFSPKSILNEIVEQSVGKHSLLTGSFLGTRQE